MSETKVVKNASTGYGYKYSSLADLAKAGIEIPKMRVKPTETGDYIEYWDGEEWQIGSKIELFEGKSMNKAQIYGAALTYARRYTVMMSKSIACDDDDAVEKAKPVQSRIRNTSEPAKLNPDDPITSKQYAWLKKFYMEKLDMPEYKAKIELTKFRTVGAASNEISRLVEEDKANG